MPPSLILSIVLGSIIGLLFHSLVGRRLWQLPCYWLAAVLGFFGGEAVAVAIGMEIFRLGTISLPAAMVGALLALGLCWFFTSPPPTPSEARSRRRQGVRR